MKLPILKDGIVVNVIAIDDDTQVVTKAQHKELCAKEDAEHETAMATWRKLMSERKAALDAIVTDITMGQMMLAAVKERASTEQNDGKVAALMREALKLETNIQGHQERLVAADRAELPTKPHLVRGMRWFHHEGLEAGPVGGEIGDVWDGKSYTRPVKAVA